MIRISNIRSKIPPKGRIKRAPLSFRAQRGISLPFLRQHNPFPSPSQGEIKRGSAKRDAGGSHPSSNLNDRIDQCPDLVDRDAYQISFGEGELWWRNRAGSGAYRRSVRDLVVALQPVG